MLVELKVDRDRGRGLPARDKVVGAASTMATAAMLKIAWLAQELVAAMQRDATITSEPPTSDPELAHLVATMAPAGGSAASAASGAHRSTVVDEEDEDVRTLLAAMNGGAAAGRGAEGEEGEGGGGEEEGRAPAGGGLRLSAAQKALVESESGQMMLQADEPYAWIA